jgi:sugar O-acyltransferase (sialic acid O-acetyltransferase NeuD family)
MQKELYLIGGGGHCKSCIDVIEQEGIYQIKGIIDLEDKVGKLLFNKYQYIGTDGDLDEIAKTNPFFLLTIGHMKDCFVRKKLFYLLKKTNQKFPVVISPTSIVSKYVTIDEGTIIMHNAVVNAGAKVGKNCIINTGAIVEHDVEIGDFCHISTGAIINGRTKVAKETFIGSNAICKENIVVENNKFIHCHSRIISNI